MEKKYHFSDPNIIFMRETEKESLHNKISEQTNAILGKPKIYLNEEEWVAYQQYLSRKTFEKHASKLSRDDQDMLREIHGLGEFIDPKAPRSYDDIKWEKNDYGSIGRIRFANGYALILCKISGEEGIKLVSVHERKTSRSLALDVIPDAVKEGFKPQHNYSYEKINRIIQIVSKLKGSYYPEGYTGPKDFVIREDNTTYTHSITDKHSEKNEYQVTERKLAMTNSTDNKKEINKIVINTRYGGFNLSEEALAYLEKQPEIIELREKNKDLDLASYFETYHKSRSNPALVRCVETLGEKAFGGSSELSVVTIEGNKYRIREYDGVETVETPNNTLWIEIKSDKTPKKPIGEIANKEKAEQVDLTKMFMCANSVKSGKTRPDALQELYAFTQKDTTPIVLGACVMHAQEMGFYPKGKDQEAVNPVLVPYILKVMHGAIENPNSNATVTEISLQTLDNFEKTDFEKEWKEMLDRQMEEFSKKLNDIKQRKIPHENPIDTKTARIRCATFYMGARGMDLLSDNKGNTMLLPRMEGDNTPLPVRIHEELNCRKKSPNQVTEATLSSRKLSQRVD